LILSIQSIIIDFKNNLSKVSGAMQQSVSEANKQSVVITFFWIMFFCCDDKNFGNSFIPHWWKSVPHRSNQKESLRFVKKR
jgi:hypothetical protein